MSIYHFSAQMISRSNGRSSIAAAAYRAAEKMVDKITGLIFDFRQKKGVDFKQIFLPKNAPSRLLDRATLWREVEEKETRKNSQTAREINVALPVELTREQQIDLAQRFVKETFVDKGMVADLCLHDLDPSLVADDDNYNPHFHLMLTTRNVDSTGFTTKNRSWNERDLLKTWREQWASYANKALEEAGHDARIDHRSLVDQGITDREPGIHLGPTRHAMQKKGKQLDSLEPQRERQRQNLKRAAQAAVYDKIDEAARFAQEDFILGDIEHELQSVEYELQQLQQERADGLRERADALRVAIEAEEAEIGELETAVAAATNTVGELEQHLSHTVAEIESRGATGAAAQDAIRAAKEHIRSAKQNQQRLKQDLEQAQREHSKVSIRHEFSALGIFKRRGALRDLETAVANATAEYQGAQGEHKEAQQRSPNILATIERLERKRTELTEAIERLEKTAATPEEASAIAEIQGKIEKTWRMNGRYVNSQESQRAAVEHYLGKSSGSSGKAPTPAPSSKPKG